MSDRFVEELLRKKIATREQITKARHAMRTRGGSFTKRLRRAGCDADEVLKVLSAVSGLPRASSSMLQKADIRQEALPPIEDGIWWRLLAVPFGEHGGVLQVAFVDPEVAKEANLLGLPEHAGYLGSEKDIKALLQRIFGSEPENSVIVTGLLPRPNLGNFDRDAKTQRAPVAYEETIEKSTRQKDVHTKIEDVFEVGTQDFELLPSSESAVKTGVVFLPEGPFSAEAAPLLDAAAMEPVSTEANGRQKASREEVVARLHAKGNFDVVVGEATAFFDRPDFSELSPEDSEVQTREQITKEEQATFKPFEIDGYRAIEKIGSGATADVFLVEDRESDAFLALKIMSENARHHAQELTRFKRAVKLMRDLEHPAIVKIIDFGAHRRAPYMVMEYFDGGTLKQLLAKSGALPPVAAVMIAESILEALSHAHAMNVVHRDLKPENILLSLDGKVAISDLGLARRHGKETTDQESLTQAGETLGSAPYMAPEQVVGKKVDARADLFSVGVMLYEMLTGASPFQAEKYSVSLFRVVESDVNETFVLSPSVPMALDWVVQRLMKKELSQRFQSARAVLQELRPAIQFIRQQYPTLLTALVRSPSTTLDRLHADQGQAELHRVDTLLRAQPPQFIEACFAAWRAALLLKDPGVYTYAKDLAQRFRLFIPKPLTATERPPALREDLWQNAAVHARAMATRALNSGDIVSAALHLRRHLVQTPGDQHGATQLRIIVGQNPWAPFPA